MRALSAEAIRGMLADSDGSAWLPAIIITDATLPAPLRFVANTQDVTYAGSAYLACPFEIIMSADDEETTPTAKLRIQNVDRQLMDIIRTVTAPPSIGLEVFRVPKSGPLVREVGVIPFSLLSVQINDAVIEGTLGYEIDVLNEAATAAKFTPANAPGLFA